MAQSTTRLSVVVPVELADAVDGLAHEDAVTRSDVVRRAIERLLTDWSREKAMKAFEQGYAGMSPQERREYEQAADQGAGASHEALIAMLGPEDEGAWW